MDRVRICSVKASKWRLFLVFFRSVKVTCEVFFPIFAVKAENMRKLLLAAALAACTVLSYAKAPKGESIELKSAQKSTITVTVDGTPVKVTWYVDNYVTNPNRPEDQKINIYVPENATKSSPIMFYVNN